MQYPLTHILHATDVVLLIILGIKFLRIEKDCKLTSYSMFVLAWSFAIRSVFIYYNLFASLYWILPEVSFLIGVFGVTYSVVNFRGGGG